jgi:uncharacterized RDD family membrane protein YckC
LDNRIWVDTPEQIRFQYQVVGGLKRAVALALDFVFMSLMIFLAFAIFALTLLVLGLFLVTGPANWPLIETIFGLGAGLLFVIFFILWWFYGVIQEYRYRGRTWGKMCLGIKVLGVDGRTPTLSQCLWRNFLRLADSLPLFPMIFLVPADSLTLLGEDPSEHHRSVIQAGFAWSTYFPTFAVAIIAMLATARNQRIGDLFAGTMVVESESYGMPLVPVYNDLALLSLANQIPRAFTPGRELVETLTLYVSRRQRFTVERRREIAEHLAKVFRGQFGFPSQVDADLLLGAVYLRSVCDANQVILMYDEAVSQQAPPARSLG